MENERQNPGEGRKRWFAKKFWNSGSGSFGRKQTKFDRWRNTAVPVLVILAVVGVVVYLSMIGIRDGRPEKTADSLIAGESFDPVKDFATVRDNGTVDQLERLLLFLTARNSRNETLAVKLDTLDRTVEIGDRILDHADATREQKSLAAKTKLNTIWSAHRVNTQNSIDNEAKFKQLFSATAEFRDDSDPSVARDAHVYEAMGLISQSGEKAYQGSFDSIEQSLADLLEKFPDDPIVLSSLRAMFPNVRAANSEKAINLALLINGVVDRSDTPKSQELSRFMKDIMLLYDAGIGNESKIDSIKVDNDDFMNRLVKLNSDPDAGETVVFQLDNAIDYFERQHQFDKALELSQSILDGVDDRTEVSGKALARTVGETGVARNSLINTEWSFEEIDATGVPIDQNRYSGKVTLIAFYVVQDPQSAAFLKAMQSLGNALTGRDVEFIFVEIDAATNPESTDSRRNERWVRLETSLTDPNQYLGQCPIINRFPYLILIDKNGNVDSINVPLIEAKTAIEYLMSKE